MPMTYEEAQQIKMNIDGIAREFILYANDRRGAWFDEKLAWRKEAIARTAANALVFISKYVNEVSADGAALASLLPIAYKSRGNDKTTWDHPYVLDDYVCPVLLTPEYIAQEDFTTLQAVCDAVTHVLQGVENEHNRVNTALSKEHVPSTTLTGGPMIYAVSRGFFADLFRRGQSTLHKLCRDAYKAVEECKKKIGAEPPPPAYQ